MLDGGGVDGFESVDAASDDHWYLAQLKPGGFALAARNLKRQGYLTFMPHQTVTRRRGSTMVHATRPLFPGYIFVRICGDDARWRTINSTYGINKLVSLGEQRPTRVPSAVIAEIRERTNADGLFQPHSDIAPGDTVRVISGPFAGEIARIDALSEKDRVVVLLNMMSRGVRAELAPQVLEIIH